MANSMKWATLPMAQGLKLNDLFQPKPFYVSMNCSTVIHHTKEAAVVST